jgi:hypothetical protein
MVKTKYIAAREGVHVQIRSYPKNEECKKVTHEG